MEGSRRPRALHALSSRDFRLLWIGQTVSLIGDGAFLVALGWKAFDLTGERNALALILMAHGAAMLTTLLIGGALADRYSRRALMVVSDLARFCAIFAVAVADATGHLSFALLLGLAVAFGLGDGFFYPAFGGIVPLVVEEHHLPSANALISVSRQAAYVVGPALAGALYGLAGSATVFGFDAVTFLVSASLLLAARPRRFEPEHPEGVLREIADGVRYVLGVPWLWISIGIATFVLMVAMAPYTALLPAFVEDQFNRGVGSYGTLFALQSAGVGVGALLYGQLEPTRRRVILMYLSWGLNDLCVVVMTQTQAYWFACTLVVIRGALIGFGIAIWGTLLMQLVPESKLARVSSLDFFGSFALVPVGYAIVAVVSGVLEASTILLIGFSLAFVLWTTPLLLRGVREAA